MPCRVTFWWTKCDKIPSRVTFQWTKHGKVSSRATFQLTKRGKVLCRVTFRRTKRGTVPDDFLHTCAPPHTRSSFFYYFCPLPMPPKNCNKLYISLVTSERTVLQKCSLSFWCKRDASLLHSKLAAGETEMLTDSHIKLVKTWGDRKEIQACETDIISPKDSAFVKQNQQTFTKLIYW